MEPMFSFSHRNELVETSIQCDLDSVEDVVGRIAAVIPHGFGDEEMAEVVGLVRSLRLDDVSEVAFAIEDDEETYELRVRACAGEADERDLAFLSAPAVATAIDAELARIRGEREG